jgi:gliding motility-associated-like protein
VDKLLFIVIIIFYSLCGYTQRIKTPSGHSNSLIRFTPNKTQWNPVVKYKAQLDGGALFIEKTGNLTYHLYDKDSYRARHLGRELSEGLKFHSYKVKFLYANPSPDMVSDEPSIDYVNYFIGKNSANWSSNIHHCQKVTIANLYNNIDAVFDGGFQSVKYTFIVKPNGEPENIKLHYDGVRSIRLKNNELYISTSVSEYIEKKPFVYQLINGDTVVIPTNFVLKNNIVSFNLLKEYDRSKEIIIDPLLVFSASSGSTADNFGMTATYDSRGSLYTGGTAFDIGYPTTLGAYDVSYNNPSGTGFTDVVITKYDSTGTFLKYSTYVGGGTASEIVTSLVVDKNDDLCLYGATGSADFPTTGGCYDSTFNGGVFLNYPQNGTLFSNGTDIYVAKINSAGTTLMASTLIGGSKNDGVNNNINTALYDSLMFNYGDQFRGEIQVDDNGEIYIISSTKSSDFPAVNAIDNSLNGSQDGILVKLNSSLSNIVYSTFVGGNSKDCGNALTLDDSLNVYITGGTCSTDFYTTTDSYKPAYNGGKADGYICKVKFDGSAILHSTFIGTGSYDQSYFVQLDNSRDVYIFGQSQGAMPVTLGTYSKINSKQFIQKLSNQLDTLLASTVIGNSTPQVNISPSAFSVDCAGNIYLTGWGGRIVQPTSATFNMPVTPNAIQSTTDGHNFYVMVLGPNMGSLIYGSYFGGSSSWEHVDGGTSRFDKKGIIYQSVCAGCANNDDFPVSPGAWPSSLYGTDINQSTNCNNGVFKIDFQLNSAIASIATDTLAGCAPLVLTFTNSSTPNHQYIWDFGANDTTSTTYNPVRTFTAAGTYTVNLYVKTSICNNQYDTAAVIITVYPKPTAIFTSTLTLCSNSIATTNNSTGSFGPNPYSWDWGDGSPTSTLSDPSHTYNSNGTYTVSLTVTSMDGCTSSSTQTVGAFSFTPSVSSNSICAGSLANLNALGGTSYTWQPAGVVSNSTIANPTANPSVTTIFTVQVDNNSQGYVCSQTMTTQVVVRPTIVADFNFTVTPCSDSVMFLNNSITTASSHTINWNFGGGQAANNNTVTTQIYANGNYSVSLVAVNNFGCRDSIIKPISVFNFTTGIVSGDSICRGYTSQLNAGGGTSYTWSPASGLSNPFIASPVASPSTTTVYSVTIQNNSPGYTCTRTHTASILVYPKINTEFTYTIGSCFNDVQFTDASFNNPVSWVWNFGDANISSSPNPLHLYNVSGTYTASLISTNNFGCKDTAEQIIVLPPFTPISVNNSITKCETDTVQLNATGGVIYSWQPVQSLSNASIASPLAFPTTSTIYTVTILALNGSDTCQRILTTTVTVFPFSFNSSSVTVNPSTLTLGQSSSVTLNGLPINSTITVVPNVNVTALQNNEFLVTPTKSGEYAIYATDQGNCRHYLKTIYVYVVTDDCNEGLVYLPTGFTPNNDGVNDILYIRSNFITDVYLTIYDRWGEKLFETNDINKGWDGMFKGKALDQGVYGYYMTFTCNNGEQSFKKGNISLMR